MVFHVGISWCKVYVYNDISKESFEFSFKGFNDEDLDQIHSIYEEIKSKINGELGCACVFLLQPSNDYRKKILEKGLDYGFKKIQITDRISSIYFNAVFQSNYKPKNGDVIWIFDGDLCRVWKKENDIAMFYGDVYQDFIEQKDLEKVKAETKLNELPDIILSNVKFESGFLEEFAPQKRSI